jgi:hypothetical protein
MLQRVNGKPGSPLIIQVLYGLSVTTGYYFFFAARPRPAGAARNEIPVRIAFC